MATSAQPIQQTFFATIGMRFVLRMVQSPLISMTGWTLTFTLNTPVPITKTVGAGIALLTSGGIVDAGADITIDGDNTVGIAPGKYYFKVERTNVGLPSRNAEGYIHLAA